MRKYIGTKLVEAEPAKRYEDANEFVIIEDSRGTVSTGEGEVMKNATCCAEGYKVRYPDGYESWSPKEVFEEAYRPTGGVNFGLALEAMKKGFGARLPQWKPDVVIRAQYPNEHSKMTAPYLYVESRFGRVPWKETMIELFSDEWEIVE